MRSINNALLEDVDYHISKPLDGKLTYF